MKIFKPLTSSSVETSSGRLTNPTGRKRASRVSNSVPICVSLNRHVPTAHQRHIFSFKALRKIRKGKVKHDFLWTCTGCVFWIDLHFTLMEVNGPCCPIRDHAECGIGWSLQRIIRIFWDGGLKVPWEQETAGLPSQCFQQCRVSAALIKD